MTGACIILDLETTGLSAKAAGIVELGAVALQDGVITSEWSSLCYPGFDYVKSASHWRALTEVFGISPALLLDAPTLEEVSRRFLQWGMQELGELPLPVTSFNRAFDQAFVKKHLPYANYRMAWGECLMLRSRRHLRLAKNPSLNQACEHFGIAREGQHRALDDARAAALLAIKLEGQRG